MKELSAAARSEEGERMKQEFTGQLIEYDQCRRMAALLLRAKGSRHRFLCVSPWRWSGTTPTTLHHAPQIWPTTGTPLPGRTRLRREPTQQQFEPLVTAPMVSVTSRVVYIPAQPHQRGQRQNGPAVQPPAEPQHQRGHLSGLAGAGARWPRKPGENGELTMQRTNVIKEKK